MKQSLESVWSDVNKKLTSEKTTVLDASVMAKLTGGGNSAGLVCSVSAECTSDGHSCGRLRNLRWSDLQAYIRACWDAPNDPRYRGGPNPV